MRMNNSGDIANIVVNEQLNRMLEQERKRLVLFPPPEFGQECPFSNKDQLFEEALHIAVMMKISILAKLN